MTQNLPAQERSQLDVLQTIEKLLNIIEQLKLEVKELREENQHLRDVFSVGR